jgi:hypothetical protein
VSTVPAPITIYHQVWTDSGTTDTHGNPVAGLAAPVPRQVQAISEFGRRGSSHEIINVDYLNRVETLLEIGVPDVSIYNQQDEVIIGATGVDDDGNPIGGVAFHVEGTPSDNKLGPFPLLNNILGGSVRVRRVT